MNIVAHPQSLRSAPEKPHAEIVSQAEPTAYAERGLVFFSRWPTERQGRPIGISGWCARQFADGFERDHPADCPFRATWDRYARDLRAAADVADAQIDAELMETTHVHA